MEMTPNFEGKIGRDERGQQQRANEKPTKRLRSAVLWTESAPPRRLRELKVVKERRRGGRRLR